MLSTAACLARLSSPLKVAVIGAGPSGFYASARLLSAFPKGSESSSNVEVHMYERLPAPHGLVRYGVAPDHPDVKNVIHKFDQVAEDPRFRFFGNVNVSLDGNLSEGADGKASYGYPEAVPLSLTALAQHYTHLVLTYGASLPRPLGIPGSGPGELRNVHSALDYVNWYNGHPAAHDEEFLSRVPWRRSAPVASSGGPQRMAVVGAGNVALDVARITLLGGVSSILRRGENADTSASASRAKAQLAKTDIPESVLAALSDARIEHVDVFARRGPAQLAMTNKELREMMALPGIAFEGVEAALIEQAREEIVRAEHENKDKPQPEGSQSARARKRLLDLLAKGSTTRTGGSGATHSWALRFFRSPAALHARNSLSDLPPPVCEGEWNVTQLPDQRTAPALDGAAPATKEVWGNNPDGPAVAIATGATERLPADIVVSSVGYRSEPLSGASPSLKLPFDARRGLVPNTAGRVSDSPVAPVPGLYVAGWLASGPLGVIASTMYGAYSMVDTLLEDWRAGQPHLRSEDGADVVLGAFPRQLQGSQKVVGYGDWLKIDEEEKRRGQALGKEREKFLCECRALNVNS